jgi:hypothetical protein
MSLATTAKKKEVRHDNQDKFTTMGLSYLGAAMVLKYTLS